MRFFTRFQGWQDLLLGEVAEALGVPLLRTPMDFPRGRGPGRRSALRDRREFSGSWFSRAVAAEEAVDAAAFHLQVEAPQDGCSAEVQVRALVSMASSVMAFSC